MKNIFSHSRPEENEYFQLDNDSSVDCFLNSNQYKRQRVDSISRSNSPIRTIPYQPNKIILEEKDR